jgi:hypothetical protein
MGIVWVMKSLCGTQKRNISRRVLNDILDGGACDSSAGKNSKQDVAAYGAYRVRHGGIMFEISHVVCITTL